MKPTLDVKKIVQACVLASTVSVSFSALGMADWQPTSSEKLIKLPAQYMDKSLQQSFRESALATSINAAQVQLGIEVQRMQDLRSAVNSASGDEKVSLQHQLLESKSAYLELMQEKLQMDQQALEAKNKVYEQVMNDLRREKRKSKDPVVADTRAMQQAARQRLEQSVAQVDLMMTDTTFGEASEYRSHYAENLNKIEELKAAIRSHVANEAPAIDGLEVSREEYVRHLLANIQAEQALVDQEELMLTYMAKLVALDAQALEQTLIYDDQGFDQSADPARPVLAADLFLP